MQHVASQKIATNITCPLFICYCNNLLMDVGEVEVKVEVIGLLPSFQVCPNK